MTDSSVSKLRSRRRNRSQCYLADAIENLECEAKEANVETWKLERNETPMTITALLLHAAHFTKVALLRTEALIERAMASWSRNRSEIVQIAI